MSHLRGQAFFSKTTPRVSYVYLSFLPTQWRIQGGLGPPPPPHTHTGTLDFVLLTLLALDVQTLRKSYKAGLEVDLLQRQSIVRMQFM